MKEATEQHKLNNRRRMKDLGLDVDKIPPQDRASFLRGNLQVHMSLHSSQQKRKSKPLAPSQQ